MIKSQDDLNTCNNGDRSVDVLIHTIEKCEKLEKKCKQLKAELMIARDILQCFVQFAEKYKFKNIKPIEEKIQELTNIIID